MTDPIRTYSITLLLIISVVFSSFGQKESEEPTYCQTTIIDGDTVPVIQLEPVSINDKRRWESRKYQRLYSKIKPKVVKVYPYARIAGMLMNEYEEKLRSMNTEVARKTYMKRAEKELKAEFKGEIKDLTITEGRILIKLIDRETTETSYKLIKDLKGGFSAFFWQGIARVFGHDLKAEYDPDGADRVIEDVVLDIKMGAIELPEREPRTKRVRDLLKDTEDRGKWWKLSS